ncbi:MAG TPA: hydroxyacid dehydrogenase [Microbacteriaceae bacterium]
MNTKLKGLLVMEQSRRNDVYPPSVLERLQATIDWVAPACTREQLESDPQLMVDADVLFTGWGAPVLDAAFLALAPRLRLVLAAAGSIRATTTTEFWDCGIPIVSAASANAIPVAEYAFAQIILALKQAHRISREVRATRSYPDKSGVTGAYGARVGILSLGEIGRLVAARMATLDVTVAAYDPFLGEQAAHRFGVQTDSLQGIFATSDVVSVHTPLLDETVGLIDEPLLRSMKRGATLINTARGAVINEGDLALVLLSRPDLTAVLDVTWPEPPATDSALFALPNVVLTGHVAGSQGRECARMGELVTEEVERFARRESLKHAVDASTAQNRA